MKLKKKNLLIIALLIMIVGFSMLANMLNTEAAIVEPQIPVSEQISETEAEEPIVINAFPQEEKVATTSEAEAKPSGYWVSDGRYRITHYCNCRKCCGKWAGGATASGKMPKAGRTIATGGIPFGTKMKVNGAEYIVEDRGVGRHCIDIFVDSHSEALKKGMYYTEVYIWKAAN